MIATEFKQKSVVRPSKYNNSGKTNIFISHNWNPELLVQNNYYGIKAGDVLYARSLNKRIKFNNLRIGIVHPASPKTGKGGLHAYTNDLVLPESFYLNPIMLELSNKPFASKVDTQVTYVLTDGSEITTSPKTPPIEGETNQPETQPTQDEESETKNKVTNTPNTETEPVRTDIVNQASIIPSGMPTWLKVVLLLALGYAALKFFKVI